MNVGYFEQLKVRVITYNGSWFCFNSLEQLSKLYIYQFFVTATSFNYTRRKIHQKDRPLIVKVLSYTSKSINLMSTLSLYIAYYSDQRNW